MQLAIRPAVADDQARVVALWRACGLVVEPNDPDCDFELARTCATSDVLVGTDTSGLIIGAAMVGHDGHRGYIHYVCSDPAIRGVGVGRRMVEAAETWIAGRGIRRMHLMVRETNTLVMPFYERLGFEKMPYQVMSKWLDT